MSFSFDENNVQLCIFCTNLKLDLVVDGLGVLLQFNLLDGLELTAFFGAVDDLEALGGQVVLFKSVAHHSEPDLILADVGSGLELDGTFR